MQPLHSLEPWIPDFCRRERVLAMLAIAELVVILLALAPGGGFIAGPQQFLSASAFALWMAVGVAGSVCAARVRLLRLPALFGWLGALSLTALVTGIGAAVVYVLYDAIGAAPLASFWRFVIGSAATATLSTALIMRYFYVSDRWQAQVGAQARAEADALQARIRPHFLFNSMNMITSLIRHDPDLAERAVLDLSDLFRAALGAGEGGSTLDKEVELARQYLAIESLRLGDRLRTQWDLQEPVPWSQPLPRLVLQPLIENAILHGISQVPEGGEVGIHVRQDAGMLRIVIDNPAPEPGRDQAALHRGSGHAQRNIAYRLGYQFGARASLSGGWREGRYRCEISVPMG